MVFQNRNSSTPQSGGGGFLKVSEGAVLAPAAGVITPTDTIHHVSAGTVSSIATTNLDTNVDQPLILIANGAIAISLGSTIIGRTTALATNDVIMYVLDGGTAWREVAVIRALAAGDIPSLDASKITTGIVAMARGGTGAASTKQCISRYAYHGALTVTNSAMGTFVDFGGSFTTTITTLAGDTVCIRVQSIWRKQTAGVAGIFVDRNGTLLPSANTNCLIGTIGVTYTPFAYEYWDSPTAGTYTYKPQLYTNDGNTADAGAGNNCTFVVELWR